MSEQSPKIEHNSPPWSRNAKMIVAVVVLLLITFAFTRFTSLIRQLVYAGILAYLLEPIINLVDSRTPLKRSHSIGLAYVIVLGLLIWGTITLSVAGVQQINGLIESLPTLFDQSIELFGEVTSQEYAFLGFSLDLSAIDWQGVGDDIATAVQDSIQTVAQRTFSVVGGAAQFAVATVSGLTTFVVIYMMSIYISAEMPHIGSMVSGWATLPGYKQDAERLWREFGRIWKAYLRGQIILGFVMGFIVWIGLAILGVNNAGALGLLSGVLEFLPIVGPIIAGGVAIMVAFFQPENWMGVPVWQYALFVTAFMVIAQQLENGILVPRIVGEALDLHPLVTLLVVFMGSTLAGVLGAILAAPVAATLKLLGSYAWRKMFDQPPFPEAEEHDDETPSGIWTRLQAFLPRSKEVAENQSDNAADG